MNEGPVNDPFALGRERTGALHVHGEKEGRPRVDPPRPVRRQPAGEYDAVDVRMMLEALPHFGQWVRPKCA
jgi:hypothetical protein